MPSRSTETTAAGLARAYLIAAVAVVVVVVAVVVPLVLTEGSSGSSARTTPTASAHVSRCASSGCALVSLSRRTPRVTVFYGASCTGLVGAWFFNALSQGTSDELAPSYALHWSFTTDSATAKPNGRIVVAPSRLARATLTLKAGKMVLAGVREPGGPVSASGTLTVQVGGTSSAPSLTFTEVGLRAAERELHLLSPFDVGGAPLVVPVRTVSALSGC